LSDAYGAFNFVIYNNLYHIAKNQYKWYHVDQNGSESIGNQLIEGAINSFFMLGALLGTLVGSRILQWSRKGSFISTDCAA